MKRILNSIAVLALVVTGAVSCQKELSGPGQSGQEVQVSLDLTTDQIGTRAYADGQSVDVVHVHVYQKDASGNLSYISPAGASASVQNPSKDVTMSGGRASYSTRLVTGQTYTFVFWAEKNGCGHYSYDPYNQSVAVNYASAAGNDESRDAFYGVLKDVTITGAYSASVTLSRPFAQINFGVTAEDLNAASLAGVTVNGAAVKLTNVANSINLMDGSVSGTETVSFANATLPSESFSAAGVSYNYVAMDYVLVGKDAKTLSDVTLTLDVTGTTSAETKYTYPNVPLQGNYRTNIVGNLFTSPADIDISVDPGFSTPDNDVVIKNVASIADANTALAGGATSVKIAEVTATEAGSTTLKMPATAESISIEIENIESAANLQIVAPESGSNPKSVSVTIPSTTTVDNLTINLPQSHVEINGMTVNTLTASTNETTLVVGKDVTISKKLILNEGNAVIHGKVNTIKRGDSNPDAIIEVHAYDKSSLKSAVGSQMANKVIVENDITFSDYSGAFDYDFMRRTLSAPALVLDLNGHKVSKSGYSVLEVKQSEISIIGEGVLEESSGTTMAILISGSKTSTDEEYSVLNIGPDVTVKGNVGILVNKPASSYNNYGIVVNCENKFEITEDGIGATVNGSNTVKEGNVPVFNFKGASIIGGGLGIYAAGYAEWEFTNTTIDSNLSALEVRAGKVTINSGDYKANCTPFSIAANGSGTTIEGAALGISQHTTDLPIDVVVNGGTFTGEYAVYEKDVQNGTELDKIKLTVKDGIFNGAIYSQNNPNCLVKGTYSDPSALNYLADGADVKIEMEADNEIASEVSVSQNVAINLNNHTLKLSQDLSSIGSGSLAISNGTVECIDQSQYGNTPPIHCRESSVMSFDHVAITSNGSAIYVETESNFTIKNSTVQVKGYGIATNASNPAQNPTINIENCTITGNNPVFVNIPCSLNVKESQITGKMQGAVVRGGTANFTKCEIALNYPDADANDMAHYFDSKNWGSGNMINLAAMTIGNKHATSYQYPTNVTLVDTDVKVVGDYASFFPALYAYANSGEGLGVTLTYDEDCTFTGGTGIIYGSSNIVVNGTSVNAE